MYIGLPVFPSITKFKNCKYINSVYIVSMIKMEIKKKTERNNSKCSKMFLNEDCLDARSRNRCTLT